MKKIIFFISFFYLFSFPDCGAQTKDDPKAANKESCLALVGFFSNPIIIKNIKVELFDGPAVVDSAFIKSTGDFGFVLSRNKQYAVRISAPGYYSRLIMINTALADNINTTPLFIFEFEIELLRETKGVDDYYMDFPIALIAYDPKIEMFGYRKKYTANMQRESRKVENKFLVRKAR